MELNHNGIAIILRGSLLSRVISQPFYMTSFELLVCFFNKNHGKFIIAIVYRLSCRNVAKSFFEELISFLVVVN